MTRKTEKVPVKRGAKKVARPSRWEPLHGLREEVDRLFDDFASSRWPWRVAREPMSLFADFQAPFAGTGPAVDVVDKGKTIEFRAELPGMDSADVDVQLTDTVLTIRGEKKEEREEGEKEGSYYLSERRYGSFQRSFRLPEGIDAEKATAEFRKGVLTVMLPKTAQAREKTRKIKVKSAA